MQSKEKRGANLCNEFLSLRCIRADLLHDSSNGLLLLLGLRGRLPPVVNEGLTLLKHVLHTSSCLGILQFKWRWVEKKKTIEKLNQKNMFVAGTQTAKREK